MNCTVELLERMFKPAQVLLVDTGNTEQLESVLHSVCAVELEHYTGKETRHYDVVMVGMPRPDAKLLNRLKESGPIVLVGAGAAHPPTMNHPLTVLPSVTERGITDLFAALKIKMRTPEVTQMIAAMA